MLDVTTLGDVAPRYIRGLNAPHRMTLEVRATMEALQDMAAETRKRKHLLLDHQVHGVHVRARLVVRGTSVLEMSHLDQTALVRLECVADGPVDIRHVAVPVSAANGGRRAMAFAGGDGE